MALRFMLIDAKHTMDPITSFSSFLSWWYPDLGRRWAAEAFEHVVSGRRGCAGHVGGIRTRIQMSVVKQPTSTFLVNKFQLLILSVLPLQSRKVHEGPAKGLRKPSW